jgi:hypothetical protein
MFSNAHGGGKMSTQLPDTHPPQIAVEVDDSLYGAVKTEVQHEIHNIEHNKEPVDPTQSDVLVQKHFPGLFIVLLSFVVLVLLAAISGIAVYGHH